MHFQIAEIRDFAELARLMREWLELWAQCPNTTPFQHPDWLMAWMAAFRPAQLRIYVARENGRLAGIAPMYIQPKDPPVLAPIGAAVSDYIDWLVRPQGAHALASALLQRIMESEPDCVLDISDVPGNSALLESTGKGDGELTSRPHDVCPVLDLPLGATAKAIVPRHQLRSLKTARRDLMKMGPARILTAKSGELDRLLDALFALHGARWSERGGRGVLAGEDVRTFHRRLAPGLLDRKLLRLYGLQFEERIIAVLYALLGRDVTYCYLQGFDPEFRDFSPGAQLVGAVIEDAIREQKRAVDFLRGAESYKYAWGARDQITFRLQASRRALPVRAA